MEHDPMGKCSYESEDLCFNPQKPQKSDIGAEEMTQLLSALGCSSTFHSQHPQEG